MGKDDDYDDDTLDFGLSTSAKHKSFCEYNIISFCVYVCNL